MVIEEHADTEKDKELALTITEELRIAYTLAQQARARVIDRLSIGIVIAVLSLGITVYTIVVISKFSLWVCAALIFGTWIALANLIKLQRPLVEFVPQERLYKRKFRK
jgi:hypothetical protein